MNQSIYNMYTSLSLSLYIYIYIQTTSHSLRGDVFIVYYPRNLIITIFIYITITITITITD